jgi:hypothetical protein
MHMVSAAGCFFLVCMQCCMGRSYGHMTWLCWYFSVFACVYPIDAILCRTEIIVCLVV